MAIRCARLASLFFLLAFASTSRAGADPLRVTSGAFQLNSNDTIRFVLRGDGFALPGYDFAMPIPDGIFPFEDCLVCGVGDPIRMGSDVQERELTKAGGLTVFGGTTYDPATDPLYYSGSVMFESETVAAPSPDEADPLLIVERPFTFSATLYAFLSPARTGSPAFTADLFGSGTARLLLLSGDPGTLNFGDLTYTFDAADPVPEPATLTLIGSGIAGILLRVRRRGRTPAV